MRQPWICSSCGAGTGMVTVSPVRIPMWLMDMASAAPSFTPASVAGVRGHRCSKGPHATVRPGCDCAPRREGTEARTGAGVYSMCHRGGSQRRGPRCDCTVFCPLRGTRSAPCFSDRGMAGADDGYPQRVSRRPFPGAARPSPRGAGLPGRSRPARSVLTGRRPRGRIPRLQARRVSPSSSCAEADTAAGPLRERGCSRPACRRNASLPGDRDTSGSRCGV
ncbi:hypothetical protein FHX37_1815 [Haloactinospora alba]|uniref:Uncharacterized protein n=1 Tax=Haloactinospora alba TaxID=405555 RepID=A0A543NJC8_9ACTN|nr:hypothetical protein FHX37_1815 [Haloactinospora alba]